MVPLLASWLLAAAFPRLPWVDRWQTLPPDVPLVSSAHDDGSARPGHVRSSVIYFVVIIAAAFLCALPVELSKLVLARRSALLYSLAVVHQWIVACDLVRSYAWDWWLFLLSISGIRPIGPGSWMEAHFSTAGRWPWVSAVSGLLLTGVLFLWERAQRPGGSSP